MGRQGAGPKMACTALGSKIDRRGGGVPAVGRHPTAQGKSPLPGVSKMKPETKCEKSAKCTVVFCHARLFCKTGAPTYRAGGAPCGPRVTFLLPALHPKNSSPKTPKIPILFNFGQRLSVTGFFLVGCQPARGGACLDRHSKALPPPEGGKPPPK